MIIAEIRNRRKNLSAVIIDCNIKDFFSDAQTDKEGVWLLDSDVVADEMITPKSYTDIEIETFIRKSNCKRARNKAVWYVSTREHSEKEIFGKLKREYPDYACEDAIEYLKHYNYVNDERFAELFSRNAVNLKNISKREAMLKMQQKGIDKNLASDMLESAGADDDETIKELLNRKYYSKLHDDKGIESVFRALMRKGFSVSSIKKALAPYKEEILYED